ncbi:MAG: alpha/beta hydrolase [Polyangiales bacterium]
MPRRVSIRPGGLRDLGRFEVPGLAPRRVRVHVPPCPPIDGRRPVLFLFDGQNVFGDAGAFAGGWHAHDAVDRLAAIKTRRRFVPRVGGLDHGGEARIDELSPVSDGRRGGKLPLLIDWLAGTLVPLVQHEFGVIPGPHGASIGGSSMGGLAALWAHHARPDVFGGAISMSPALWFAGRSIFADVGARPKPEPSRIWLDCGTREAGGRMVHLAADMARMLASRGYAPEQLAWLADPRGGHDEKSWRRRFPRALRFMAR